VNPGCSYGWFFLCSMQPTLSLILKFLHGNSPSNALPFPPHCICFLELVWFCKAFLLTVFSPTSALDQCFCSDLEWSPFSLSYPKYYVWVQLQVPLHFPLLTYFTFIVTTHPKAAVSPGTIRINECRTRRMSLILGLISDSKGPLFCLD
jgi:hypothetical protein